MNKSKNIQHVYENKEKGTSAVTAEKEFAEAARLSREHQNGPIWGSRCSQKEEPAQTDAWHWILHASCNTQIYWVNLAMRRQQ